MRKGSVEVVPTVRDVIYGEKLNWRFEYKGAVNPRDHHLQANPVGLAGYRIKDSEGNYYAPDASLRKRTYSLEPQKTTYETALYAVSAKPQAKVTVGNSDLVELRFEVKANGAAASEATIVCQGERRATTDGKAIVPVSIYATADYIVSAPGYQTERGSVEIANKDRELSIELNPVAVTLSYQASANGSIAGERTQQIASKGDGTAVEAIPENGYVFDKWSDNSSTEAQRRDTHVGSDLNTTALFRLRDYTLTYSVGEGGQFADGSTAPKTLSLTLGQDGEEIAVKALPGYYLAYWPDEKKGSQRKDKCQGDASYKAIFKKLFQLPLIDDFETGTIQKMWTVETTRTAVPATNFQLFNGTKEIAYTYTIKSKGYSLIADCSSDENGGYSPRHSYFTSGVIDIATLSKSVMVGFDYSHANITMVDAPSVQISVDGGEWEKVKELPMVENVFAHEEVEIPLAKLSGHTTLQVRIDYMYDWEFYFALDNVSIYEKLDVTHTLSYVAEPSSAATFEVNGSPASEQRVKDGEMPQMVKPAYDEAAWTFLGWSTGQKGEILFPNMPCHQSETISAHFESKTHFTVSYQALPEEAGTFIVDNTSVSEQSVAKGQDAKPVTAQPKAGFRFAYWKDNGSAEATRENRAIAAKTHRVAVFEPVLFEMNFIAQSKGQPVPHVRIGIDGEGLPQIIDGQGKATFRLKGDGQEYHYLVESPFFQAVPKGKLRVDTKNQKVSIELTPKAIKSIYLSPETLEMNRGEYLALDGRIYPLDIPQELHWSSSAPNIVYVDEIGNIYAASEGQATITVQAASDPGKSASCTISVKDNRPKYKVNIPTVEHGSILVAVAGKAIQNGDAFLEGTVLHITATPDTGAELLELSVNGKAIKSGTDYTVKREDVQIAARFKAKEKEPHKPSAITISGSSNYSVSPNPTRDILRIANLQHRVKATVYSANGMRALAEEVEPGGTLDVSRLAAGVYLLRIDGQALRFVKI